MEQSTLTSEQSRWASAIAKLTSLTYAGKLRWIRVNTDTMNNAPVMGLSFTFSEYETELTGQKFSLIVSEPSLHSSHSWSELLGMSSPPSSSTRVNFRAYDQYKRKVVDLTDLSILNTLASAVESEAASRESLVLAAIENA